jgi:hypothetical protein
MPGISKEYENHRHPPDNKASFFYNLRPFHGIWGHYTIEIRISISIPLDVSKNSKSLPVIVEVSMIIKLR